MNLIVVKGGENRLDLVINLHAQPLQKDAIEHNCSHYAVITCTQPQPDLHLAPEAST